MDTHVSIGRVKIAMRSYSWIARQVRTISKLSKASLIVNVLQGVCSISWDNWSALTALGLDLSPAPVGSPSPNQKTPSSKPLSFVRDPGSLLWVVTRGAWILSHRDSLAIYVDTQPTHPPTCLIGNGSERGKRGLGIRYSRSARHPT